MRVLVVEAEPTLGRLCVKNLSARGFEAETASSGQEALQMLSKAHFGILLAGFRLVTGISGAGMDGCELAKKALESQPDLSIIIHTVLPGDARKKAEKLGILGQIELREKIKPENVGTAIAEKAKALSAEKTGLGEMQGVLRRSVRASQGTTAPEPAQKARTKK